MNLQTELPIKAIKADAPIQVTIHYERDGRVVVRPVKHRTRNARLQVSMKGAWRTVPRRGYFKFDDGTIGRVQLVSTRPELTTDKLREKLKHRYRISPWRRPASRLKDPIDNVSPVGLQSEPF